MSASLTLAASVAERLKSLALALGFKQETEHILSVYHELIDPWADVPIHMIRQKKSAFATDATPLEISVAISDGIPELRFSMEVIGQDPTIAGKRKSALAFIDKIQKAYNLNLDQYYLIQDLFLPQNMQGKFAMFQSVRFSPNQPIIFDIHLNPKASGDNNVNATIHEALKRLGYQTGWPALTKIIERGGDLDQFFYFCLDVGAMHNRVKIYSYHKDTTLVDLTRIFQVANNYVPTEQENFVREMTGGLEVFSKWWLITTTAFTEQDKIRPATVTAYVPMFAYTHDDAQAYERIHHYLAQHQLQPEIYHTIIDTFKNRELKEGVGMQNWISLQRRLNKKLRWTIYLATESLAVLKPGTLPKVINQ